jgi:hypothetical protein
VYPGKISLYKSSPGLSSLGCPGLSSSHASEGCRPSLTARVSRFGHTCSVQSSSQRRKSSLLTLAAQSVMMQLPGCSNMAMPRCSLGHTHHGRTSWTPALHVLLTNAVQRVCISLLRGQLPMLSVDGVPACSICSQFGDDNSEGVMSQFMQESMPLTCVALVLFSGWLFRSCCSALHSFTMAAWLFVFIQWVNKLIAARRVPFAGAQKEGLPCRMVLCRGTPAGSCDHHSPARWAPQPPLHIQLAAVACHVLLREFAALLYVWIR